MPATTPTLKIPYPLDSDPLRSFPQVAKDAATILDSASTIKTATLPLFDGAWRYEPEGGLVRTVNGTNHLSISIVRTGGSFHMDAGGIIDIFRINNTVKVPSTREWVMCGTLVLVSGLCQSSLTGAWCACFAMVLWIFRPMVRIVDRRSG